MLPDQALVLDDANFPALTSPGKANPAPEPKQAAPIARPISPTSPLGSPDGLLPPATPVIGDGSGARDSCTGSVASSDERCTSGIEDEPFKPAAAPADSAAAAEEQPPQQQEEGEGAPLETGKKADSMEDAVHANGDAAGEDAPEQQNEAAGEDGGSATGAAAAVQPSSRPFQPASAQQVWWPFYCSLQKCYEVLHALAAYDARMPLSLTLDCLCGEPQGSAWARKDKLVFAAEDEAPPACPRPSPSPARCASHSFLHVLQDSPCTLIGAQKKLHRMRHNMLAGLRACAVQRLQHAGWLRC